MQHNNGHDPIGVAIMTALESGPKTFEEIRRMVAGKLSAQIIARVHNLAWAIRSSMLKLNEKGAIRYSAMQNTYRLRTEKKGHA